jgi:hypothetical protein
MFCRAYKLAGLKKAAGLMLKSNAQIKKKRKKKRRRGYQLKDSQQSDT